MDRLILERLVDKVLTPERVTVMLKEWLAHQAKTQGKNDLELKRLEKVLAEMALVKRDKPSPMKLSAKQVAYACQRMREMLLDASTGYGKQLLGLLVEEIRVAPGVATMTGSTAALNQAVSEMKMGTPLEVPRVVLDWRPEDESNVRPTP